MLSRPRLFTGVLLDDVSQPQDAWLGVMNPDNGQEALLYSLGDGRVRAYLGYPRSAGHRLDLRASFGQGLAMALRGVRMLRDHLLAADDWDQQAMPMRPSSIAASWRYTRSRTGIAHYSWKAARRPTPAASVPCP